MRFPLGVGILWALCAGFTVGVFLRSISALPDYLPLGLLALALVCVLLNANDSKKLRLAFVAATLLLACGAGILRMQSAVLVGDPALDAQIGKHVSLEGIVSDEPDIRATQVRVPIQIASTSVKILAIFPAYTDVYYGEHVHFSGTLQLPQSFDAGAGAKTDKGGSPDPSQSDGFSGRQFNYPGYLAAQGISYELDRAKLAAGEGFYGNPLTASAYKIKELFVTGLERALPEPQSGLAGGIDVGDKRAMGKDLTQEFRTVSLVHIVVLSGYNITVVIGALFRVLSWAPRVMRFGAGGFVALFFAVMTGFASASLRAALMALIAISGTLSGRIYRADRALALVSLAMLVWNPYLLVFDPGFQLSFLACSGLLVFSSTFTRLFARVPKLFGLQGTLISTSSAQIAVLPLLLYESGNLSLVSIPANLLVLEAVPPAMLFSAIAAIGGLVFEPLAPIIGFPANALLSYILGVAHFLASVPFAAVMVPAFSAWLLAPIYATLFGYGLYDLHLHSEQKETAPSR
jgi:competence protein ComEC